MHLPFESYPDDAVTLSSVREEKRVVLFKRSNACEMEIWITTKIDPTRSVFNERLRNIDVSLFVDEKKKVALVFCKDREDWTNFTAYMIGKDGYYKEVYLGESTTSWPFVYSYIPSRPGLYKDVA
ncbi:unnamed protein product [Arabidopsis thaliana]|uniref:F-box/associated interaction domain protein n=2 Tax=Arabidopsis thaliana TaxID=3702 RepID=A0A1I9LSV6_ARATH|nr:F-box/associated interaction domain protein [Arabidopsis thaliana]ANM65664.1 F-box/associated interaction domain protein [Arabidopsis thaliana]VYS57930.1 unnamed protein product [Arabidopsis thaliana]|eukprot:NP_001327614.1 F-box/associated interaction domain protein [Arabidopsis thaliana]